MSGNDINRRNFLKVMGWGGAGVALSGCDMPTTVTLEEGKETVVSYIMPEEYVIPGQGVYFASTCQQCSAGCGVHGRVREGRVLKLEGNTESPINTGKLCQMGQSGVQAHYNPDRIQKPMLRKGGALVEVTWEEAAAALADKTGKDSSLNGGRAAWLTGTVSGHQSVLLQAHLEALGSSRHYTHEVINNAVATQVNQDMFGEVQPTYHVTKAKVVLSFGADLVGTSMSPVHFSREHTKFRSAPRGVLIQVEPKMTLTGGNADLWIAAKPGSEGVLAMGIANELLAKHGLSGDALPGGLRDSIASYNTDKVVEITGVAKTKIVEVAKVLAERSPSLVLTGASTEAHEHGYQSVAAAMMLNVILGNIGKTITSSGEFPFPQLTAKRGDMKGLLAFAEHADKGEIDVAFFYGVNPVYTAPKFLNLEQKLDKIPFKVVLTQFYDETANRADLVLPLASALEDWGTHVPGYLPEDKIISMQQPLMEKLYKETHGLGDVLLSLLKMRKPEEYEGFADYYAFLREAFAAIPSDHKGGVGDEKFWMQALQFGVIPVNVAERSIKPTPIEADLPALKEDISYPFYLVPSAHLGLWDGRHANLPWLQEAPDQISKVVWGSWVEMHPKTAARLGVENGEFVRVESMQGSIEAPLYTHRGIHPNAVAVPLGQGHEEYGRYAKGRGVNPLKILNPVTDEKTGEPALYGTRVQVAKAPFDEKQKMVRFGGSETQVGRKLVASITADVFNRTEGA